MNIANPNNLYGTARDGDIGTATTFAFPFETIEDVIIENKNTLTVLNDNNFPGSSGRNASVRMIMKLFRLNCLKHCINTR
jgi:hypothetical protein